VNIELLYQIFRQYPIITTNSRICPTNSLFFALRGEKFDGNDYIMEALMSGAIYAVGDRNDLPENERIIKVGNVLQTLQSLANYHRKLMNAKIIAITGTNGKTTTKELIATVLSSKYKTLYTQENLNNYIGVPLTLLRLNSEHQFAVIEMGASHVNEIRMLCQIAEPDYGIITNVGKAHLEGFGSLDGVVKAKTELYDFIRDKGGVVFANLDNLILKEWYNSFSVIYYGTTSKAFVYGRMIGFDPTLVLEWSKNSNKNKIVTHFVGGYNLENILASICVANYFGVEDYRINVVIANYIPINNRSQNCKTKKNNLIVDAYNANPDSMRVALDNFYKLRISPKMVILGEMGELGSYSKEEHQKVLNSLWGSKVDKVFLIGRNFEECLLPCSGWKLFRQTEDCLEYLRMTSVEGYHILIKGSRNNQLEKIFHYL
jgi:UDP-N-acetylmuramoyl-tripeptide--D-alanyl-D-alanine ligase